MDATEFALPDAVLVLYEDFLTQPEADRLFAELSHQVFWKQEVMNFYGHERKLPRLTAWYGEPEARYQYSGILNQPLAWTPTLASVREHVQQVTGHSFNSVLLNLYRSGADSVSWHADNEPELGRNPVIASISLGEVRVLQMRHTIRKDVRRFDLSLSHGSLLLMKGEMQTHWQHRIPKTRRSIAARINLTFRNITRRP
jgi:alkylated DNA repair dioxygenase AlkB